MSSNNIATGLVTNNTGYTLIPIYPSSSCSSGYWTESPQPITPKATNVTNFVCTGVSGTATGAAGVAWFNIYNNNAGFPPDPALLIGTLTWNFDDPYTGSNSSSATSNLPYVQGVTTSGSGDNATFTLTINYTGT